MNRYFLHVRGSREELRDEEGHVYDDAGLMEQAVLRAAREMIAADVLTGVVRIDNRIDVEDENGRVVHSLRFKDAVTLRPAGPAASRGVTTAT